MTMHLLYNSLFRSDQDGVFECMLNYEKWTLVKSCNGLFYHFGFIGFVGFIVVVVMCISFHL